MFRRMKTNLWSCSLTSTRDSPPVAYERNPKDRLKANSQWKNIRRETAYGGEHEKTLHLFADGHQPHA
jgi:hypothetical protein